MSLMGTIAAMFGSGSAGKACVVDGDRLAGGDRIGPGERFQVLNKLARFAAREELQIKVVFGGRPLREAADGEKFNDVAVYYGETSDEVRKRLAKLAGGGAILITSDQALELETIDRGGATMRMSTFRKALDASSNEGPPREGGGGGLRDRDRNGDGGRRGRGRHRGGRGGDRRPRPEGQGPSPQSSTPADASGAPARAPEQAPAAGGSDNSVKNLIDLVE